MHISFIGLSMYVCVFIEQHIMMNSNFIIFYLIGGDGVIWTWNNRNLTFTQ